jgi:Fe-Mn family superoxide dismutase
MITIKSHSYNRIVISAKNDSYQLPKLPYSYAALEPIIDAETMQIHHKKHQKTYLDNLLKDIQDTDLIDIDPYELASDLSKVPEDKLESVKNNLGGFINHNMFWRMMQASQK